ncbi:PREDICTED: transmembrane protein 245 [Polistes canadensis]|uniref:transmembrane protein 245 n=1 Tax=Polistes canadensis TaxID=91411 RepID=UPI000718AEAB|nr:PREDICTED: transmembrane protein 245 [Polistes canadensis]
MDVTKSPMDNLFNMLSGFNASHEKALKQGIYNAVALFLLSLVLAAGYGLYIVLSPFLKPLIWALLCGAVLFPFKYSLTTRGKSWFNKTESTNKPLFLNFIILPLHIIDNTAETLGTALWDYIKYIVGIISMACITMAIYSYTPNILSCLIWQIFNAFSIIFGFFISTCNIYMITFLLIGYLSVLYIYWSPENSKHFCYTSFVLWFMISLYISNIFGAYQILIFITLQVLYLVGFIYEVLLIMEAQEIEGHQIKLTEAICFVMTNSAFPKWEEGTIINKKRIEDTEEDVDKTVMERSIPTTSEKIINKSMSLDSDAGGVLYSKIGQEKTKSMSNITSTSHTAQERFFLRKLKTELRMSLDIEEDKVDTDKYMYGALYACIGMILWKHKWIIQLLIIPIAYYFAKKLGSYFGLWKLICKQCKYVVGIINDWCKERNQALLPANVRGLYKVAIIVDEKLQKALIGSIDAVATTAVIVGLLVFTICTSIFITIQVYAEGMHLIQVTAEIVNSSLINNPDIDWVPQEWEESVNSVLDNAYTYGRSAISDGIRKLVKDLDSAKTEQMETKVLELWDRLYQAWMMSNEKPDLIGPTVDSAAAYSVWESFRDNYGSLPLHMFDMTGIQNFAKENVGILMSLLDSVWNIVKGNMSVILTVFTELFYIILMSGTAVFNFILSMIVFFTTLFYLLNSSGKTYKPIELTTLFSPINCDRFAVALQKAVIGVFAATFKLATFFGMWTWFVHNLFQVKIIYLPSAFATVLGAVPFLDAYIACIPATLELWFTRGSTIAIPFFMFHFLPCNIVVTEFYKEIKGGGHPYLTGLSIAGGIFCLGVEGAIFGPLLLCCIMVVINLSRHYLNSPSMEMIKTSQMSN